MPKLRLDIDQETYLRLADQAVAERRPIDWQAEVTLRRAVGLPFPPSTAGGHEAAPSTEPRRVGAPA